MSTRSNNHTVFSKRSGVASDISDAVGFEEAASGLLVPHRFGQKHLQRRMHTSGVVRALYRADIIPSDLIGPFSQIEIERIVALFAQFAESLPLTESESNRSVGLLKAIADADTTDQQKPLTKEFLELLAVSRARATNLASEVLRIEQRKAASDAVDIHSQRLSALLADHATRVVTPLATAREHSDVGRLIKDFLIDDYLPPSQQYKQVFTRQTFQQIESAAAVMCDRHHVVTAFMRDALAHCGYRMLPQLDEGTIERLDALVQDFPNFADVIEAIKNSVWINLTRSPSEYRIEPLLLNGPPATGKTTFAQAVSSALGVGFRSASAGRTSAGFVLAGSDSSWSSSKPGVLARAAASSTAAWGVFLLDEIDKAGADTRFPILPVFLDLLEPHTARTFVDEFLATPLDMSQMFFIATSNSTRSLADPLLSRMRTIDVRKPTSDERVPIVRSILRRSFPQFVADDALIEFLAATATDLRKLRRIISDVCAVAVRAHLRSDEGEQRPVRLRVWHAERAGIQRPRLF